MNDISITQEMAEAEVNKFLYETKNIDKNIIEFNDDKKDSRDKLIEFVKIGRIILSDEKVTIKLQYQISESIQELELKNRITVGESKQLDKIKENKFIEKTIKLISILSINRIDTMILNKLDSIDMEIINSLLPFYM